MKKMILFLLLFSTICKAQFPTAVMNIPAAAGGGSHIIQWNLAIDQSQCGGATSDTFTIPIYLRNDSLKHTSLGGYVADWEGDDIRFFITDTTSLLHWYNVRYRPDSGIYEAWVKVYATNVNFKMCVGSTTVTTFQGGSAIDVWKSTVVAAYPMNDTNGNNLTDISGNGLHATPTNTPVRVPGQIGFAESITGSSSQVYTVSIPALNGATKFSFLFWGKRATSGSNIVHGNRTTTGGSSGITCFLYSDGWAYHQFHSGYSGVSIPGTAWIHSGMVFDGAGATAADRSKIYINGVNQILSTGGVIPTSIPSSSSDFIIGKDGTFSDRQSGLTDMLILYKSALSAAWVTTAHNSQLNLPNLGNSGTPFVRLTH